MRSLLSSGLSASATTARRHPPRDPELDQLVASYHRGAVKPGTTNCTDPAHSAEWEGAVAYLFRRRARLSRKDVRDALRGVGLRVTMAAVRRWEHAASGNAGGHPDVPNFDTVRALAALYHVEPGRFVSCAQCEHAARGEAEFVPDPDLARRFAATDRFLAAIPGRVTAARRARGMSPRALARAAEVEVSAVVAMERGFTTTINCNEFMWIIDALGLSRSPDREPDDGEPVEPSTANVEAVAEQVAA